MGKIPDRLDTLEPCSDNSSTVGSGIVHYCAQLLIRRKGVMITTPVETEPWGQRFIQVTDPNGVVIQLVQWMTDPSPSKRC